MIIEGDCLEKLKTLEANSIDAVVTDPPYGLKFMGKKWDYDVPSLAIWSEVIRVCKPGAHLLSFGSTRTYHRLISAIEDAGFEIRDQLQWLFGSGFPKSMDVSKAIDKMHGAERKVIGNNPNHRMGESLGKDPGVAMLGQPHTGTGTITAPATEDAKKWEGWGTALKPANEPIVLARKPLSEKTVALNVLKWGVGAMNIDASRIAGTIQQVPNPKFRTGKDLHFRSSDGRNGELLRSEGRWPANVLFDEEAAKLLDEQSGGASRFFYCAKASKSERNRGFEGEIKEKEGARPNSADPSGKFPDHDHRPTGGNNHPTVKPVKLMEYLIRLIAPPASTVLDPFCGSGTTGVAARSLGYSFIGIEMNPEYCEIARKRIGS